jgi:hypothetical protein
MGLVGHIFLSSHLVNELACGFSSEILRIFKKCIIWLHFPILELGTPPLARRNGTQLTYVIDFSLVGYKNQGLGYCIDLCSWRPVSALKKAGEEILGGALEGRHFRPALLHLSYLNCWGAIGSGLTLSNRKSIIVNHSYRSATMGSTCVARRAGIELASRATLASSAETAISVVGSVVAVP